MRKESIYTEVLNMLNDRVDYKSITLAEVAKRCDMGKSTIYEYFKSKDEMIYSSILYYLNNMIKFFAGNFEINSFRPSLKTYIKAVAITMKANYWMVYPWTFIDNYAGFLSESDAKSIDELLNKSRDIIYTLFSTILQRGEDEGILFKIDETRSRFAFNGILSSLTEFVTPDIDLDSVSSKAYIEELCSCVVKELN